MSFPVRVLAACCRAGQCKPGVEIGPIVLLTAISRRGLLHSVFTEYVHDNEFSEQQQGYIKLYEKHKQALKNGNRVLALGGDHSISRSTAAATAAHYENRAHVVWVDAHADIHTPETSISGNTHGMPISDLIGLTNMMNIDSYILKPEQFTYIGLRDVEEPEQKLLDTLDMQVYTSEDVHKRGIEDVMQEVVETKIKPKTAVHLSLDVDALDPKYLYSTGTRVDNGLTKYDVSHIIDQVKPQLVAADIVEFNPKLGNKHQVQYSTDTATDLVEEVVNALRF